MADIAAIRDRLATAVIAVDPTLRGYDTMPDSPLPPCFTVAPAPGAFLAELTMDGAEDLSLVVLVLVKKVAADTAQDALDAYLSEVTNIANAIDSGHTADWDYAQSGAARNYGEYEFGTGEAAARYLGFEIPVMVAVS